MVGLRHWENPAAFGAGTPREMCCQSPHDASWGLLESRIVKNLISIYLYLYLSVYPYIHISISVCNHHFAHGNCRFFWVSMDNPRPNPPAPDARARSRAGVGSARAVAADAPRRA